MRRQEFHATDALGRQLFDELEVLHLAGVADGQPVLKSLNGVVDEGWVCFHGAPAGEKTSLIGQPVVASVEETIAVLPSYFMDPRRPARPPPCTGPRRRTGCSRPSKNRCARRGCCSG